MNSLKCLRFTQVWFQIFVLYYCGFSNKHYPLLISSNRSQPNLCNGCAFFLICLTNNFVSAVDVFFCSPTLRVFQNCKHGRKNTSTRILRNAFSFSFLHLLVFTRFQVGAFYPPFFQFKLQNFFVAYLLLLPPNFWGIDFKKTTKIKSGKRGMKTIQFCKKNDGLGSLS